MVTGVEKKKMFGLRDSKSLKDSEVVSDHGESWDGEAVYSFMFRISQFPCVLSSKQISNSNTKSI